LELAYTAQTKFISENANNFKFRRAKNSNCEKRMELSTLVDAKKRGLDEEEGASKAEMKIIKP